jgi:CheY-like chemotaxis protein
MFDIEASKRSGVTLTGRRILVVDDSPTNMEIAVETLETYGAQVDAANDGKRALEMVAHAKYDLVLLDLDMPVVDGYAVGAAIRASRDNMQTPIVLFTAADVDDAERAIRDVHAQDIAHKPVDIDALMDVVVRHLEPTAPR